LKEKKILELLSFALPLRGWEKKGHYSGRGKHDMITFIKHKMDPPEKRLSLI